MALLNNNKKVIEPSEKNFFSFFDSIPNQNRLNLNFKHIVCSQSVFTFLQQFDRFSNSLEVIRIQCPFLHQCRFIQPNNRFVNSIFTLNTIAYYIMLMQCLRNGIEFLRNVQPLCYPIISVQKSKDVKQFASV